MSGCSTNCNPAISSPISIYGIGKYSGLEKININGHIQESVRLIYKNNDILYVSINSLHKIAKYAGKDGTEPQLHKLGSEAWKNLKAKTKKKVKDIAKELIQLYAKRKAAPGFAFSPDNYLQNELEASFIYEDTPDQLKATVAVKEDMLRDYPMDRLICGDVGFGKTEVAVRAAFKTVLDKKQVAILVPTTILALQHAKTFAGRLNEFGVEVEYINRFRSPKEKRDILQLLKDGKIDIIIGTHALLSKDVAFKDLGLLIVDEEQKFGVSAKERLRNFKVNVDTLTLTATPIPRTLQFSLMSARDLSVIRTPPPNRQPIHTEVRVFNEALIKESIYYEVNRGGQVFFVHNRVKSLPDMTAMLQRLCPDVEFRMAHGQLDVDKLEKTLVDFIDKQFEVLVCTNIIETGLDIPNANTMISTDAHQFGMSDLHQLRGRIGRSNRKAFCYLFSPPMATLSSDARKRLRTIEEFSDLGSGIQIAMRDLDIRGAGNLLGAEQSGFIADIGFETFQRILDEAMRELKETDFKELFRDDIAANLNFVSDVIIDTDVEMLIPSEYVSNITERLALYTELDAIENEEKLAEYTTNMLDRFGKIPKQVRELFDGLRLRWVCRQLGFERIILKNGKFRAYFVENPQSPFFESDRFKQILAFVGSAGKNDGLSLKQSNKSLILVKDGVKNLKAAKNILEKVLNACLNA
jgi:transcription-repair coupling factor (superfamily II helicase)